MAQTVHAIATPLNATRPAANEDRPARNATQGDKWNWLIERLKTIDKALAVFAAKERLKGVKCEAFCMLLLRGAELAGWESLEDWEG